MMTMALWMIKDSGGKQTRFSFGQSHLYIVLLGSWGIWIYLQEVLVILQYRDLSMQQNSFGPRQSAKASHSFHTIADCSKVLLWFFHLWCNRKLEGSFALFEEFQCIVGRSPLLGGATRWLLQELLVSIIWSPPAMCCTLAPTIHYDFCEIWTRAPDGIVLSCWKSVWVLSCW